MILSQKATILATFLAAHFGFSVVDAHGYLKSPRSRNYHASVDGRDFGGDSSTPKAEYCEHCLNRRG